jgi:putative ABC transport system permease protein
LSAAALLLRRVRSEAAVLLLLFGIVACTSFLFAAAPRLLNRVSDDAVRYGVTTASPVDRNLRLDATGFISPGTEGGVSGIREYAAEREAELPGSVEALVSDRFLGVTTVHLAVERSIIFATLRYQERVTDDARLVAGRWPVDLGMPLKQVRIGDETDATPPTVFEAAVSSSIADAIGAHVGDRLPVALDVGDARIPRTVFGIAPTDVEIVGIYEALDPTAEEWAGSGLLEPTFIYGVEGIVAIYATAYIPAEAYPSLEASQLPFIFDWHYKIDPARVDGGQVEALHADLQRLSLIAASKDNRYLESSGATVGLTNVSMSSGLLGILDGVSAQRARAESVLSIAALGPFGLAGGAIGMLALLLVRRRRHGLLLARGRGASGGLLLGTQLLEVTLLAGSAAVIGLLLALSVVPARAAPLSPILALVVAVTAVAVLVAATWPAARRPLVQFERDDPPVLRVPPRRLVIEATIVIVAVVAVVLLRQRGLTVTADGDTARADPLLAAVPLLSGLAAGVIAMRLYPLPVRALGWLAARRTDFVPVVGLRTVARHPAVANLPLLVLMLTAAFGSFASVIQSSINQGQIDSSYLNVGADYRLEAIGLGSLPASLDPATLPGVAAAAAGVVDRAAAYVNKANERSTIDLDMVDAAAYAKVTAHTASDPRWPSTFLAQPPVVGAGTEGSPIPAIASAEFPPGNDALNVGDTFTVKLADQPLQFRLVGRSAGFAGLGDAPNFAIVPLDWMTAAGPAMSLAPTVMWLRGSTDAAEPLATAVSASADDVHLVSRHDLYRRVHEAPLGMAVAAGFGIALGVSVLYLALTMVGAVIMSAAGRSRDLAYLRTLGVSTRQALALTAVENAPPVLVAIIPGVLLGVGIAEVVGSGLRLGDFIGAEGLPLYVDWVTLGIVTLALCAVVILAIGAGTWLAARARLASALRIEDS